MLEEALRHEQQGDAISAQQLFGEAQQRLEQALRHLGSWSLRGNPDADRGRVRVLLNLTQCPDTDIDARTQHFQRAEQLLGSMERNAQTVTWRAQLHALRAQRLELDASARAHDYASAWETLRGPWLCEAEDLDDWRYQLVDGVIGLGERHEEYSTAIRMLADFLDVMVPPRYARLVVEHTSRAHLFAELAELLRRSGRHRETIARCDQAIAAHRADDDGLSVAHLVELEQTRAKALLALGAPTEALAALERACQLEHPLADTDDPVLLDARLTYINAALEHGHIDLATAHGDALRARRPAPAARFPGDPLPARWHLTLGRVCQASRDHQAAEAHFAAAGRQLSHRDNSALADLRARLSLERGKNLLARGLAEDAARILIEGQAHWRVEHLLLMPEIDQAGFLEHMGLLAAHAALLEDPLKYFVQASADFQTRLELTPAFTAEGEPDAGFGDLSDAAKRLHGAWFSTALAQQDADSAVNALYRFGAGNLMLGMVDEFIAGIPGIEHNEEFGAVIRARTALRETAARLAARCDGAQFDRLGVSPKVQQKYGAATTGSTATEHSEELSELYCQFHKQARSYSRAKEQMPADGGWLVRAARGDQFAMDRAMLTEATTPQRSVLLLVRLPRAGREPLSGFLVISHASTLTWISTDDMDALQQAAVDLGTGLNHQRGYRFRANYAESASRLAPPQGGKAGAAADWASAAALYKNLFWQPLAPYVEGLSELCIVPIGLDGTLLVELGAPQGLVTRHYPSLAILGYRHERRTRLRNTFFPPVTRVRALSTHWHAGEQNDIPHTRTEMQAVEMVWQASPKLPLAAGIADADATLAAYATHGHYLPGRGLSTFIEIEPGVRLDMHRVHGTKKQPYLVIMTACVAGQIEPDVNGNPLGLVAAFLLRGTEFVIASVLPLPDDWTPVFSLLLHQALARTDPVDPVGAFLEAKRRFAVGEWYPHTRYILDEAIARNHALLTRRHEHRLSDVLLGRNWQEDWPDAIEPELRRRAVADDVLDGLFTACRDAPAEQRVRLVAEVMAAHEAHCFDDPLPPDGPRQAILHGLRIFG